MTSHQPAILKQKKKEIDELRQTIDELEKNPTPPNRDDYVFTAADLGKGWFIVQVKSVISQKPTVFNSCCDKYDILIGLEKNGKVILYDLKNFTNSKQFVASTGVSFHDSKIDSSATYKDLSAFAFACINSGELTKTIFTLRKLHN